MFDTLSVGWTVSTQCIDFFFFFFFFFFKNETWDLIKIESLLVLFLSQFFGNFFYVSYIFLCLFFIFYC